MLCSGDELCVRTRRTRERERESLNEKLYISKKRSITSNNNYTTKGWFKYELV